MYSNTAMLQHTCTKRVVYKSKPESDFDSIVSRVLPFIDFQAWIQHHSQAIKAFKIHSCRRSFKSLKIYTMARISWHFSNPTAHCLNGEPKFLGILMSV